MSLSDPIGDMIARVKNAQARNHKKVELPSSNFKSKIADILKNEGYNTMAIGKWHLGHQPEYLPTARGFDSFGML
mgnify:CR=1 FL=1